MNFVQLDDDQNEDTMLEDVDDSFKTTDFTGISDYNIKSYDTTAGDEGLIWIKTLTAIENHNVFPELLTIFKMVERNSRFVGQ